MRGRTLLILLSVLALALVAPSAAVAKRGGTDRPVQGQSSSTTTIDVATGTGSSEGSGRISHLGKFTFTNDITSFTLTGPTTFSLTLTGIIVAANGDVVYTTATGTGTLTPTGSELTLVSTIIGGTGRFTDASGTITTTISSVTVSMVGTSLTSRDTEIHTGRISY